MFFYSISFILILAKWRWQLDLGTYDGPLYHSLATNVSTLLSANFLGNLPHIFQGYSAYTVPLGLVYFIFGSSELVGQLFNTFVALGIIYNLYHLALICFNLRVAKLTAWAMALYPFGWLLSTTLNRDISIAFFLTLLFRLLAEALAGGRETSNKLRCLSGLGCVVYLTLLRPPLLLLCGLTLAICLLMRKRGYLASPDIFQPLRALLVLALLVALGGGAFWAKDRLASVRLIGQAIQFTSLDNLNHRLESSEDASSAYMRGMRYDSAQDILTTMPLATLYFMYSPLPWQVRSPKQALGLVDAALLLLVTYFFCKGARRLHRLHRKFAMVLFTFLIVGFCTSSLLQSNVGAAMRHRTMFFFLMIPVAVQGFRAPSKFPAYAYPGNPASASFHSPKIKESPHE
jgi:4-amino-4-deoxy-L-arabinose transferase-like glycosyltransferase